MADVANGTATEQDISQEIIQNAKLAVHRSAKRTREIFAADFGQLSALDKSSQPAVAPVDPSPADKAQQASVAARIRNEYADVKELPAALAQKQANAQAGERTAHVPRHCFDDVAGLEEVKSFIRERMIEPALDP